MSKTPPDITPPPNPDPASAENAEASAEPRRGFLLRAITAVIGFVIVTVPAAIGGVFFLDPLWKRKKGDVGFVPITRLDSLPDDGTPVKFTVRADLVNAWNKQRNQPIGSIYLRKMPEDQVIAFNTVCPHLGCSIDYTTNDAAVEESADEEGTDDSLGAFWCPCHESSFKLSGERLNSVPPRDMDTLNTKIENGEVLVEFQNFRTSIEDKIPT